MIVQPKRPLKLTRGNVTVMVLPHQPIRLPDAMGKRLLDQAPDRVKRVTPKR